MQGGGWGAGAGATVFEARSVHNGRVHVTAHACGAQQWRVLRFNADTRQSVALCTLLPGGGVAARPEVLAMEYLKVIASQALGLWRLRSGDADADAPPRVLCIGGGGCSLPLFLARFLPGALVDVAEIDAAVVEAAPHLGVPAAAAALAGGGASLRVHARSAQDFLADAAAAGDAWPYDLVVLDAFDGDDAVPPALLQPAFLAALSARVHPARGAVLLNTHGGQLPPLRVDEALAAALRAARGLGEDPACRRTRGYDCAAPAGRAVVAAAAALAAALRGDARAVRVERQGNVIVCVLPGAAADAAFAERLRGAAAAAGLAAGVPFECGERAVRGLHLVAAAPPA